MGLSFPPEAGLSVCSINAMQMEADDNIYKHFTVQDSNAQAFKNS